MGNFPVRAQSLLPFFNVRRSLTHLCHVRDGARVVHQFPLVHLHLSQSGKAIKVVQWGRQLVVTRSSVFAGSLILADLNNNCTLTLEFYS